MNTICGTLLGVAIVATFTWPTVVVTIVVGFAVFLVLGTIAVVIWERVWTRRNIDCHQPCEWCDAGLPPIHDGADR